MCRSDAVHYQFTMVDGLILSTKRTNSFSVIYEPPIDLEELIHLGNIYGIQICRLVFFKTQNSSRTRILGCIGSSHHLLQLKLL